MPMQQALRTRWYGLWSTLPSAQNSWTQVLSWCSDAWSLAQHTVWGDRRYRRILLVTDDTTDCASLTDKITLELVRRLGATWVSGQGEDDLWDLFVVPHTNLTIWNIHAIQWASLVPTPHLLPRGNQMCVCVMCVAATEHSASEWKTLLNWNGVPQDAILQHVVVDVDSANHSHICSQLQTLARAVGVL